MTSQTGVAVLRRWELWIVWALVAIALALVPVMQGGASVTWDTLNHHVYLGWIAEHHRFDKDVLAAGWQSHQYPYLYWPVYKLATSGASGVTAGVAFALLQSLAVPPVWLVARSVCPGDGADDIALRWLSVALAFAGCVTLSLVDTSSNDLLAGIPFLWAIALGLMAHEQGGARSVRHSTGLVALSGLLAGISVALKLSNGPLVLALPPVWLLGAGSSKSAMAHVVTGGAAVLLGFGLAYAPWGWQMWEQYGNPVYPFYDRSFDGLRDSLGWQRP